MTARVSLRTRGPIAISRGTATQSMYFTATVCVFRAALTNGTTRGDKRNMLRNSAICGCLVVCPADSLYWINQYFGILGSTARLSCQPCVSYPASVQDGMGNSPAMVSSLTKVSSLAKRSSKSDTQPLHFSYFRNPLRQKTHIRLHYASDARCLLALCIISSPS